jgi:class 3 adenylate cyclase
MNISAEFAHILFLDIADYSKETTAAQSRLVAELNRIVSESFAFREASQKDQMMTLPTGDGMAILFYGDLAAPARCALELHDLLGDLRVRMGIHSGPVQRNQDVTGRENVAGEGINMAQRVMDATEVGRISVSESYGNWLRELDNWKDRIGPGRNITAKHGVQLTIHTLWKTGEAEVASTDGTSVVVLYKRKSQPDETILAAIEQHLITRGLRVFIDRHLKIGVEWAKAIEEQIRASDWVIAIVSDSALGSEMLEYELEVAADEHRKRGKPFILPVRIGDDRPLEGPVGSIVNPLQFTVWKTPEDESRILADIIGTIETPPTPSNEVILEPVGGAVPPDTPFYVERPTDNEFLGALARNESILLVKGPRQMGKTSLIGRGARYARSQNWRIAMTDFQKLSSTPLASDERFYTLLARMLAKSLQFNYDFEGEWIDVFGANLNLDNFMRALIDSSEVPLVWFMDEADKLFAAPFASDFFGLVRSWHNSRATEPDGPWSRFTVVLGYATEAHLFIQDLNQSPFNVGRQLDLQDFDVSAVSELNRRYDSPLNPEQIVKLMGLIGGQPFLVRRALDVVARGTLSFDELLATADRDDGAFGDHLKRILISVTQIPGVLDALRASLQSPNLVDTDGYHRLLAAGVVHQIDDRTIQLRCELYRQYMQQHLS